MSQDFAAAASGERTKDTAQKWDTSEPVSSFESEALRKSGAPKIDVVTDLDGPHHQTFNSVSNQNDQMGNDLRAAGSPSRQKL